ncbi:SDR family NAD(P)-dependent oxidoreductase [Alicyclobacillus mengziensis]|uniref:SDR family oxidoreductase n=1 Tax=Alicyclobacillus mengziensis TaxID=2931921 RepID=A0A9X7VYV2_9BACL|nr:SDR family NAD(P)-dependent oxidoreductase [Alicyclobacillus mengziensis]QSO47320.1 SDR family oxidoreductase [Alicyclobacillus mengziensis]
MSGVALITGAGSGIGKAAAHRLSRRYSEIVIVDKSVSGLEETGDFLEADKVSYHAFHCDVTNGSAVEALIQDVRMTHGRLDALVNSAGIELMGSVEEITEYEWDLQLNVNLKSMFLLSKYAVPLLKESLGAIVNVASVLAMVVAPNHTAYCASKGGVVQFTKALGFDLAPFGVRVNAVMPGPIDTPMYRKTMAGYPDPEAAHKEHVRSIPLGRIGQPEDVADVIDFLCSPQSSFVTATSIIVDGGFTASKVSL